MSHDPEPAPTQDPPPRSGPLLAITAFLALATSAGLVGLAALGPRAGEVRESAPVEAPLPMIATLPDFRFFERSGNPIGLKDLRGRIWVADFIFTNCAGVCPRMSMAMSTVHELLRRGGDACVSFTVDPERDSLDVLRRYAEKFGASAEAWYFLRGPQAEVQQLSYKGFLIGDEKDPFIHSERMALVDRQGRVRGYYHALDDEALARLRNDVERLRREP